MLGCLDNADLRLGCDPYHCGWQPPRQQVPGAQLQPSGTLHAAPFPFPAHDGWHFGPRGSHTHCPLLQVAKSPQAAPQPPQLPGSVEVLVHTPPQLTVPLLQVMTSMAPRSSVITLLPCPSCVTAGALSVACEVTQGSGPGTVSWNPLSRGLLT